MIDHSSLVPYIVAAYVVAGIVIGAMIGMVALDYRALKRALGRFAPRGLDRE